jgi:hypothetical protein
MKTKLEILRTLEKMIERYPEWRFGQMVANISYWAAGPTAEAVWDVEDTNFLKALNSHLSGPKTAGASSPPPK